MNSDLGKNTFKFKDGDAINVAFPFRLLKSDSLMLDPFNTEYALQYYLLENISSGLIRDNVHFPGGYEPVVAKKWEKLNSQKWLFIIDENSKWSDGNPITCEDVRWNLQKIKDSPTRHASILKNLETIECDQSNSKVVLNFSVPANESLLHELSLADSGIKHKSNLMEGWKVTSGPYFVTEYSSEKRILKLQANKFSSLITDKSPKSVVFHHIGKEVDFGEIFTKSKLDLFLINGELFINKVKPLEQAAPMMLSSAPNCIHYLYFNSKNKDSNNFKIREYFAHSFNEVLSQLSSPKYLTRIKSLIPPGYVGAIKSDINFANNEAPKELLKSKFKILVGKEYTDISDYLNQIKDKLDSQFNLKIEYIFANESDDDDCFGRIQSFVGNQRDPLGSWNFLYGSENGKLAMFKDNVSSLLEKVGSIDNEEQKRQILEEIHFKTLKNVYAIPLWITQSATFYSKRVNLTKWNTFDMRLRIYDVIL